MWHPGMACLQSEARLEDGLRDASIDWWMHVLEGEGVVGVYEEDARYGGHRSVGESR